MPIINSFAPSTGPVGTIVTITGTNFSTAAANDIVYFGAVKATVANATTTSLNVIVPTGATYQPITVTVNRLTAYSKNPFLVTFGGGRFDQGSLSNKIVFSMGDYPAEIFTADIDGDGKADIVTSNVNRSVSILQNTSTINNISFSPYRNYKIGNSPYGNSSGLVISDIDGDGKPDILVANQDDSTISIMQNTSTAKSVSFAPTIELNTFFEPAELASADIDGDGKPDIVFSNISDDTISFLRNTSSNGIISFAAKKNIFSGVQALTIATSDIDDDGKPDILLNDYSNDSFAIIKNISIPGTLSFAPVKKYFLLNSISRSICAGDIDGDNKPDIIVTGQGGIFTFRNKSTPGNILLDTPVIFISDCIPYGGFQGYTSINDLDGDGRADIVSNSFQGCSFFSVIRNNSSLGHIAFDSAINFPANIFDGEMSLTDLDGDSKPDIIIVNGLDTTISIYSNTLPVCTPPDNTNTTLPAPLSLQWLKTYGGLGDDVAYNVISLSDSTFVVGGTSGYTNNDSITTSETANGFVIKYSSDGNIIWQKTLGGNKEDVIYNLVNAANGGILVVGTSMSDVGNFSGNHGDNDLWVTKLDSSGNIIWQKLIGGSKEENVPMCRKTADGNYIIFASTSSNDGDVINPNIIDSAIGYAWLFKINENGNILWQKVYPDSLFQLIEGEAVVEPSLDKGFLLGGTKIDSTTTTYYPELVKTDSLGNVQFSKIVDSTQYYYYNSIISNKDSSYTLFYSGIADSCAGNHGGDADIWIGKIDKNANLLWGKYYGGSQEDDIFDLNLDQHTNDGGYLIAGYTLSNDGNVTGEHDTSAYNAFSENGDGWLLKLDSSGNLQWQKTIGGYSYDILSSAIQLPNNDFIAVGCSNSKSNGDIYGVVDGEDAIILKISNGISLCPQSDTSITSNLTGSAYQWQVNNGNGYTNIIANTNYSSVRTKTLNINNPPTSWYGYKYRCVVTGAGNSNETVLKFGEQWTGAVDSSWENAANWSCGIVPDANTDVVIKTGNILVSTNQSIRSLTVYAGSVVTVKAGFKITITGK